MNKFPHAYFITFSCYGTWLHGNDKGSVSRFKNTVGTPVICTATNLKQREKELLAHPPYLLNKPHREIVLQSIIEVSLHRGWHCYAAHVRSNHVHVVVGARVAPEKILTDFKAYASGALNKSGLDKQVIRRWTNHGSTKYIWEPVMIVPAINYVVEEQGAPMAVYVDDEALQEWWL